MLDKINFLQPSATLVEASAGTGKTWLLERLYVKALLEGNDKIDSTNTLSIESLLVVTFTNDACDELKARIQEQLQKSIAYLIYISSLKNEDINLLHDNNDEFVRYLVLRSKTSDYHKDILILTRALQNFDMAAIYTIHGFCNMILHDYPFECDTSTMFKLVVNHVEIIKQLVLDFIHSQIINNQQLKPHIEVVLNNLHSLFRRHYDFQSELHELIALSLPQDLFYVDSGNVSTKYQINSIPRLDALIEELTDYETKVNVKAEVLAYIVKHLQSKYLALYQQSDTLSYDELVLKIAMAITRPEMADILFTKFPVSFIDEFQDTDNLQWQIFKSMYHLGEGNNRGNVVIVGDPKQAIYRFRGADIDTYLKAKEQINNQLSLQHNYRAKPNILNFINQLFNLENQGSSLQQSFFGSGIDYVENQSGLNEDSNQSLFLLPEAKQLKNISTNANCQCNFFYDEEVQLVVVTGAKKEDRINNLLMNMTFEILALLHAAPTLIGKIAILVTKNSEAKKVVDYLRKYGIRASELRLGSIFATETALDLYVILSAVTDMSDRALFMQAMCSKLLNIELSTIFLEDNTYSPEIIQLQQSFFGLKQTWDSEGIISLVYQLMDIITTFNQESILSNRELANIWQLAELLHIKSHKIPEATELLIWLKHKIDNADSLVNADLDGVDEELIRLDNDDEQITITTQHKSKGLEYDILFCPFFKTSKEIDAFYDLSFKRPFFESYQINNNIQHELVIDKKVAQDVVDLENAEVHRLNYVTLTRAKQRVYIYLKQHTMDFRNQNKYHSLEKPDKLVSLFGYTKQNPMDDSHKLFNYPQFFGDNPQNAIKTPKLLPGVVSYNRSDLVVDDLLKLQIDNNQHVKYTTNLVNVKSNFNANPAYFRQSYTSITTQHVDLANFEFFDYDVIDDEEEEDNTNIEIKEDVYRYTVLTDGVITGAEFGILFHTLCETYPCSKESIENMLSSYNLNDLDMINRYAAEFLRMLDEAFNYKVMGDLSINKMALKIHELQFNLAIMNIHTIKPEINQLINQHFGVAHSFSKASNELGEINHGFLAGAIDLLFEHEGKYWVLDYKTNKLNNYNPDNGDDIIESMAEHHYYIQYILYLVAVKRYLETRLNIEDATDLLGGAIYYYVRGVYTKETSSNAGIYVDKDCSKLVSQVDKLLGVMK